jgi:hypothetical protein
VRLDVGVLPNTQDATLPVIDDRGQALFCAHSRIIQVSSLIAIPVVILQQKNFAPSRNVKLI